MIIKHFFYCFAFVAEALVTFLYNENLYERRQPIWKICIALSLGYGLLWAIFYLQITALNTISFFIVNALILIKCYNCAGKTAIFHSAFLSFVMTISEILIALVFGVLGKEFEAYTYDLSVIVSIATLGKLFYLAFAMIGIHFFTPHQTIHQEPGMMPLFCTLPIISAVISVILVYIGLHTGLTKTISLMIIITLPVLLMFNISFFILYNTMLKVMMEKVALTISLQNNAKVAETYHVAQQREECQRILIHDIKNHLHAIYGLARESNISQISDYITKLEETIDSSQLVRYSSNPVLNQLLSCCFNTCNNCGISLHVDIRESCASFLDAPDTASLYGNLLSNAIEAASSSQNKSIDLSVIKNEQQRFILLTVANSCDTPPVLDSYGNFLSKKDGDFHGLGLMSISQIIRKYNGISTIYYDVTNHLFHHIIRFPCD